LDGIVKEITETALEYLLAAHPGAKVEQRGQDRIVTIPRYDIMTDKSWTEERKVIKDDDETPMGILPTFNVRTGAQFNPKGDPKLGAMGQLYRIVGWTPPKEDDKE
jgi:hypothetical protein